MTQSRARGGSTVAQPKMVEITETEYAELMKVGEAQKLKKAASRAKSSARSELIKRNKPEYDRLVVEYTANPVAR